MCVLTAVSAVYIYHGYSYATCDVTFHPIADLQCCHNSESANLGVPGSSALLTSLVTHIQWQRLLSAAPTS